MDTTDMSDKDKIYSDIQHAKEQIAEFKNRLFNSERELRIYLNKEQEEERWVKKYFMMVIR